mmetsp:Transcript_76936/g.213769  ORF Transcript_76936/g.213769 Transcript_76936/m.213769 type:complete len:238 (+) Transcript_76936:58-771(+)
MAGPLPRCASLVVVAVGLAAATQKRGPVGENVQKDTSNDFERLQHITEALAADVHEIHEMLLRRGEGVAIPSVKAPPADALPANHRLWPAHRGKQLQALPREEMRERKGADPLRLHARKLEPAPSGPERQGLESESASAGIATAPPAADNGMNGNASTTTLKAAAAEDGGGPSRLVAFICQGLILLILIFVIYKCCCADVAEPQHEQSLDELGEVWVFMPEAQEKSNKSRDGSKSTS